MHSRSQPAARVRTAVSGRPRTPDAPRISSASDTITPSKPSSPRSRPPSAAGDRVAGRSPVMAGTRMWAVITARTPASMAAAKGGRSRRRSTSSGASMTGRSWWESVMVAPWPGKCLAQAATPASCNPSTAAAACAATRAGSAPNERVPITGLSSAVFTSTVGAMSRVTPREASSTPIARCTARVRDTSSTTPSAALPGYALPVAWPRRVTSPPSSSMATMTSARTSRSAPTSEATWGRSTMLYPNRA